MRTEQSKKEEGKERKRKTEKQREDKRLLETRGTGVISSSWR